MNRLVEALHSGRVLVMDGAMGTELQRLGLREGQCSAAWNVTHPEQVAAVHAAYLEAGAEVLLTNTFVAERDEQWEAALELVRMFRDSVPLVLADFGPNRGLAPPVDARRADGILLETWSCTPTCWAEPRITAGSIAVPVLLSFTFRHDPITGKPKTQHGATPEDCALAAKCLPVWAIGVNCGVEIDMDDVLDIVQRYREILDDLPIFVRPNAGTPKRTAAGWQYPRSPEYMADKLWPLLEAGVTMVGGCCGTTPAHIAAFRQVVDAWNAKKG